MSAIARGLPQLGSARPLLAVWRPIDSWNFPGLEFGAADNRIAPALGQCSGGIEVEGAKQGHGLRDLLGRQDAPRDTATSVVSQK